MNLIANQTKYGFYNRIYNRSKTSLLEKNDIEIYKGKSVVAQSK